MFEVSQAMVSKTMSLNKKNIWAGDQRDREK
jgi:hypothetical protein